jgi:hypothetical protein
MGGSLIEEAIALIEITLIILRIMSDIGVLKIG